jgi:hypothetical protein
MPERKKYTIGGTVYELLPPVFGVMRHVSFFCRDAGDGVTTVEDLQRVLKDESGAFIAGLITPQGVHPADRDLEAIARAVDWEDEEGVHADIVSDFFVQPGMDSPDTLAKAGRTMASLAMMVVPKLVENLLGTGATRQISSNAASAPSQEGAPSDEGKSSGPADGPMSEDASK